MKLASLLVAASVLLPLPGLATKTVCTITVNSADEKEALRARLPAGRYEFVELVQKGRADWLGSACTRGVRCDVLVVSGHFNAGDTFYSDRIDNPDHLAIDELERAACSESCPGLFSGLKEVYLFGCESLNPDASRYASSHGESGASRMRRIFAGVPSIYGFSGAAPVGPTAAMLLGRYFDAGGARAFASGRHNAKMLATFSASSMARVAGAGPGEAAQRARICRFFDDRTTAAAKLEFAHGLLREADIGTYLKRIEALLDGLGPGQRQAHDFTQALARLSADEQTRERVLRYARSSPPATRSRTLELAWTLGWLSPAQRDAEVLALAGDVLGSRSAGFAEVDLVCSLNADGRLDGAAAALRAEHAPRDIGHAAVLACLGDKEAHGRTLRALLSANEGEARIAQAYLRHRPVRGADELRPMARAVADMPGSAAKVRALDTLARLNISDAEVLRELEESYVEARSPRVQEAIAEVFLRSGHRSPELAHVLRTHRRAPARGGVIDSLLAQLAR